VSVEHQLNSFEKLSNYPMGIKYYKESIKEKENMYKIRNDITAELFKKAKKE